MTDFGNLSNYEIHKHATCIAVEITSAYAENENTSIQNVTDAYLLVSNCVINLVDNVMDQERMENCAEIICSYVEEKYLSPEQLVDAIEKVFDSVSKADVAT